MHGIAQGGPLCSSGSSMTHLLATIVMDERARIALSFLQETNVVFLDVLGKIYFSSGGHFSCHRHSSFHRYSSSYRHSSSHVDIFSPKLNSH